MRGLGRIDPLLLGAPIDVALGLENVLAAAAEAEHRSAHRLDRDVAGEDEQVGPADALAVLLLDRPKQPARLVEVAVVRPAVERSKALIARVGAAAAVAGAVGARRVPGHADEEGAVIPIVCRPPRLAVGHEGGEVALQRLIVELLECFGIVEVGAEGIRRNAALVKDFDRQRFGPPVAVRSAEQRRVRLSAGLPGSPYRQFLRPCLFASDDFVMSR